MAAFFDYVIKPHTLAIAEIFQRGDIAVVAFDPPVQKLEGGLRAFFEQGRTAIRRMGTRERKQMADIMAREYGDTVSARWFRGNRRSGRIFVLWGDGILLVNFTPETGYHLELGSTDRERKAAMN